MPHAIVARLQPDYLSRAAQIREKICLSFRNRAAHLLVMLGELYDEIISFVQTMTTSSGLNSRGTSLPDS